VVRYRRWVRTPQDVAIEWGLVALPEGRTRSRWSRLTSPGRDTSATEALVAEAAFTAIWLLMVAGAVMTTSTQWRLLAVLAACGMAVNVARVDDLRRSAFGRSRK